MTTILAIGAETLAVAAIIIGFQLAVLAFRNPFRPRLLGRFGLETITATAFAAALPVGLGVQISEIMAAGATFPTAAALAIALLVGMGVVSMWVLQTPRRLRLADAGQSPFGGLLPKLPGDAPPTAPAA